MELDLDHCYAALKAHDRRFDGHFFVGVATTGIYCRPICPARTPAKARCDFFHTPAAAERAGYRPCLRCRPELAPAAAEANAANGLAKHAVARIQAGALNEQSVDQLAATLGTSGRQLRRVVEQACGVTPIALAQTQRLLMAKRLLTDTQLKVADVAVASGFSSVRRFNHLFRTRYRLTPSALRRARGRTTAGHITLKLHYRAPLAWDALRDFLAARGAIGVEAVDAARYVRSVRLNGIDGWVAVSAAPGEAALLVEVAEELLPVLTPLMARLRAVFDLDANPQVIDAHLQQDARLATNVKALPGLRLPGTLDGFELALRTVIGQQVSVAAATTIYGRFAERFGDPIETPFAAVCRTPPSVERIAAASVDSIAGLGMPGRRAQTVLTLARALSCGALSLTPGGDPAAVRAQLVAMPGIGDWTAQYLTMRGMGDVDAFPASDLGILRALGVKSARDAQAAAEDWRPWRAYAVIRLWHGAGGG